MGNKVQKDSGTLHSSRKRIYVSFTKQLVEIVEARVIYSVKFPAFIGEEKRKENQIWERESENSARMEITRDWRRKHEVYSRFGGCNFVSGSRDLLIGTRLLCRAKNAR